MLDDERIAVAMRGLENRISQLEAKQISERIVFPLLSATDRVEVSDTASLTVNSSAPIMDTDGVSDIGTTSARFYGSLDDLGGSTSVDCDFQFREVSTATFSDTTGPTLSSPDTYNVDENALDPDTKYEFRARGIGSNGDTDTGDLLKFRTEATGGPTGDIDSFEDGDIAEYSGDTGQFATGTVHVTDGSVSLEATPSGTDFVRMYSLPGDGLSQYYDAESQFRADLRPENTDKLTFSIGYATGLSTNGNVNGYEVDIDILGGAVRLHRVDDGARNVLDSQSTTGIDSEKWHLVAVDPTDSGDHDVRIRNLSTDTDIASLSASDSTYVGQGGVHVGNDPDNGYKAYWDHLRLV